jgi:hypothetical protein
LANSAGSFTCGKGLPINLMMQLIRIHCRPHEPAADSGLKGLDSRLKFESL